MDKPEPQQLSADEQQILAREVAIDRCGYRNYGTRAFTDGWDAAMGYAAKKAAEGIGHLDGDCCHFQD